MLCQMSKNFGKCFDLFTWASKFLTQMPQLFIIKICFAIKVNSICGAGRDTWNLRHKFHSQGSALRILGLRVAISMFQRPISRAVSERPSSRVPCFWVPGSRVSGSWDLRSQGPRSRVSGPDIWLSQKIDSRYYFTLLRYCLRYYFKTNNLPGD